MEDSTNEIIEIDEEENEIVYDNKENEEEKVKKKKPKKNRGWHNLSKKKKILIIVIPIIVLIIVGGILLYFLVFKKEEEKRLEEPEVIVEKNNYRYEDGTLVFLDSNKKEIGRYECQNKDEDKCYIAYYSSEDSFDITKKVYSNNKGINEYSDIFNQKYVFIYDSAVLDSNTIILYNLKDNAKEEEYASIKAVKDNYLIVKNKSDKYGLLELNDTVNTIIDFNYDFLAYLPDKDNLVAKNNDKSKIIDYNNQSLSKEMEGNIKNYNEKYISVELNKDYKLYDYAGNNVIDKESDFYTFKDGYIILINNKKVYAYDDNLNLLNYDGIKLSSSNYNKKIVFDEDLKEISRDEGFNIETSNSSIRISEDNEILKEINVYEGKLNNKFQYVSYYDGILYIFKDSTKKELLGKYTCTNKNIVNNSTTELNNCFIGKEELLLNRSSNSEEISYLPIFNNRFAFINDTNNKDINNIILYDFSKSNPLEAKLATYKKVDAGFYKNVTDTEYVNTTDRVVMAENTSDNYGLIRIEAKSVGGLIAFQENQDSSNSKKENILGNTKMIKYLGNNILVRRNDNRYVVYDKTGDNVLGYASNEIVDINNKALVIKNNDSLTVTDLYGGKILKASLLYVDLQKNYFITIDKSREIEVTDYNGREILVGVSYTVDESEEFSKSYEIVGDYTIRFGGRDWDLLR